MFMSSCPPPSPPFVQKRRERRNDVVGDQCHKYVPADGRNEARKRILMKKRVARDGVGENGIAFWSRHMEEKTGLLSSQDTRKVGRKVRVG